MLIRVSILLYCLVLLAGCGSVPPAQPVPLADAERARQGGLAAYAAGRYLDAARRFREAERHFISIDDDVAATGMAIGQAEIFLLLAESGHAEGAISRGRIMAANSHDSALMARVDLLDARLQLMQGNTRMARRLFSELEDSPPDIARHVVLLRCKTQVAEGNSDCLRGLESDDPLMQARIERLRGDAAAHDGNSEQAELHIDNALALYRQHYFRPGIAAAHEERAALQRAQGEIDEARQGLRRALFLRLWIHDRVHAAQVLQRLAEISEGKERDDYLRWRSWLMDGSVTDWDGLQREVFNP